MIIRTQIFCWRENKELEKAGVDYEPENVWTEAFVDTDNIMYAHRHPENSDPIMIGMKTGDEITIKYSFEELVNLIEATKL